MLRYKKTYFVLTAFCFLLINSMLYSQQNTAGKNNHSLEKFYRQDSVKVRALLSEAATCIKSGSSTCIKSINNALKISTAYNAAFLTTLCYSTFAYAERKNRKALLFKYDSLSIDYARLSKNDSLLTTCLLSTSHDFCVVNRPEKARKLLDEVWGLLKKNENAHLLILANYEQGYYFLKNYNFNEAGNRYKEALSYAEALKDRFWIAMLHKSIFLAEAYGYKQMDKEIPIFEALDFFRKNDSFEAANCLFILGYVSKLKGNTEKAAVYFNEAAALYKAGRYLLQEAEMYIWAADILLEKKEINTGLSLTARSEKLFTSVQYTFGINNAYLTYARLYGAAGDMVKSDFYFNKVDSFLKRIQTNYLK